MDKLTINALKQLPACKQRLDEMTICSSGAKATFQSASGVLESGDVALAGARMQRCEKLLEELRESYQLFVLALRKVEAILDDGAKRTEKRKADWDRLPDSWWKERILGMVAHVEKITFAHSRLNDVLQAPLVSGSDAYEKAIHRVVEEVGKINCGWLKLTDYVSGWEEVAEAVAAGLGGSASLIPG